ncbi:MAG: ParB/RepB/Spo0J family partition protein [Candidatus Sungbacteria bacterium]|uniref:ParB/RepB/Spo0J family partition protein n=1 Tax=Candidatus Sungiibacteriota bacterium TaxID=2750080 RepID=A0A932YWH4_9BACT|nr:ParB/RepB/Spo0J family partition protein [Parcubacteria group bacterium]MBI4132737.1 ParB/RepB/Spo0J family partition protein [Candidatus Sungbacteria bacterium]
MTDAPVPVVQHAFVFREIPVDKIQPNPHQPRQHFSEESLDELGASIREKGVLQPITVRDISADGVEAYELIAGERRWRSCERIGRMTIPSMVVEVDDDDAVDLALIENMQREDLTPMEEARGLASLLDRCLGNKSEVERRIKKSMTYITDRLVLLELPEEVQHMLDQGQVNTAQAKVLLAIPDAANQVKWAKQAAKRNLDANRLKGMTQNLTGNGNGKKSSSGDKRERRVTFKGLTSGIIGLYEDTQALKVEKLSPDQRQTIVQQADMLITALRDMQEQLKSATSAATEEAEEEETEAAVTA